MGEHGKKRKNPHQGARKRFEGKGLPHEDGAKNFGIEKKDQKPEKRGFSKEEKKPKRGEKCDRKKKMGGEARDGKTYFIQFQISTKRLRRRVAGGGREGG